MTTEVLPDAEQITADYLTSHTAVQAVKATVATDPQQTKNARFAQVLVTRIGGTTGYPDWIDGGRMNIDVRAQTKAKAFQATAVVRAALKDMPAASFGDAVVCAVEEDSGPQYLPDRTVDPPRPRYTFDVIVTLHPRPGSS